MDACRNLVGFYIRGHISGAIVAKEIAKEIAKDIAKESPQLVRDCH